MSRIRVSSNEAARCRACASRNKAVRCRACASRALRWILALSLTAAPLIAQEASQPPVVVAAHRPVVQVLDENNNPVVGGTILSTLANTSQEPNTDRTATELGAPRQPAGNPGSKRAEPGAKLWGNVIIAALIAGGVIALILLLGDDDHKKPKVATAPGPLTTPTGTVLVPGTPIVGVPH